MSNSDLPKMAKRACWGGIAAPWGAKSTIPIVALQGKQHFVARDLLDFLWAQGNAVDGEGSLHKCRSTGQAFVFYRVESGKLSLT
jgi:hypothetical protein